MDIRKYFIDAFNGPDAGGNRACVIELQEWLPARQMQELARETGLPETAFFKRIDSGVNYFPESQALLNEGIVDTSNRFELRWFTPDIEMDLCGHATLATGFAISSILKYVNPCNPVVGTNPPSNKTNPNGSSSSTPIPEACVIFETNSGRVEVTVAADGRLTLDFPSRMPMAAELPECIYDALSFKPIEVYKARDYVLLYDSVECIRNIKIELSLFNKMNMDPGGVVITAPATGSKWSDCDFVSRFFTPQATILEDPVTGSAHCSLVPFWAARLGKEELVGRQLSSSGGILYCKNADDRVLISGYAKEV